jgi:hypothetical protein
MKERMAGLGFDPALTTPQEFLAIMTADLAKYTQVAKATGARLD